MSTTNSEHHHHHHHHHGVDETTLYRRKMAQSVKMRKLMPKILWAVGCAIAVCVFAAVAFAYVFDR